MMQDLRHILCKDENIDSFHICISVPLMDKKKAMLS